MTLTELHTLALFAVLLALALLAVLQALDVVLSNKTPRPW